MRIGLNCLVLKPGEYSGVHVAVRGLAQALARSCAPDDEVVLYTQRTPPSDLPPSTGNARHIRPTWPVGWRAGRIAWEQFALPRRVFKDKLDLLHCPAYVAPRLSMKPVVLSVHDIFALRLPMLCTAANRSHFSRMMPLSLERAKRVLVPTAAVQNEILEWNDTLDAPQSGLAEKIRVVPWGLDARFRPIDKKDRQDLRRRLDLPEKYVLFVGRIEPKKNPLQVIKAFFAAALAGHLPHKLVLAGPRGWGAERLLSRTIDQLGLSDRVHRLGFVDDGDLPGLYACADAVLFPSLAEGFGFPVIEAQACGTPVIASDLPVLREVGGDAVRYVQMGSLPALREAIETLLADPKQAHDLRERGFANARRFDWDAHARATWETYREVVSEDRAR